MRDDDWKTIKARFGWKMPDAPWWKRLPIIRHIRARVWHAFMTFWNNSNLVLYDKWFLYGISRGFESVRSTR